MDKLYFIIERCNIKVGDAISSLALVQALKDQYDGCIVEFRVPLPTLSLVGGHPGIDLLTTSFGSYPTNSIVYNLTNRCPASYYEMMVGSNIDKSREQLFVEYANLAYNNDKPVLNISDSEKVVDGSRIVACDKKWGKRKSVIVFDKSDEAWKDWPHGKILCDMLAHEGYRVFRLDMRAADSYYRRKDNSKNPNVITFGRFEHLRSLAGFISQADCVVSVDSGPLHIADAMNVSTVGLMGSMNADVRRNKYPSKVVYLQAECPFKVKPCQYSYCDTPAPCLLGLRPDYVMETVKALIDTGGDMEKICQLQSFTTLTQCR